MLHRLARDLNLPKLTFQVIRRTIRTIATLSQKKGTVDRRFYAGDSVSVQSTVNSIHMEFAEGALQGEENAICSDAPGGRERKPEAVSVKAFGNLTPTDTKRFEKESARSR